MSSRPRRTLALVVALAACGPLAPADRVGAQAAPQPVGLSLDGCTYETCMPRIQSWRERLILGAPDSATVLSGAAGDSLLLRTRGNDLVLERRARTEAAATRRVLLSLGVLALGVVGTIAAVQADEPGLAVLAVVAGGFGALALSSQAAGFGGDAEATWHEAVQRHRDGVAGAILARRGLTTREPASSSAALEGCTWDRCALAATAGVFSDRLVIGRAEPVSLGFSGEGLARHVRAVPAALPAARRYASAKGVANVLTAGSMIYALVAQPRGVAGSVATLGGLGLAAWQGLRARHALEEATWRYNRELLR